MLTLLRHRILVSGVNFAIVQGISPDNIISFFTEISLFVSSVVELTILMEPG
jgi:hypothetical protein